MDISKMTNRFEYLIYKYIAKNEKNKKQNAIAIFVSKFKSKERHIMGFLNIREFIIEDVKNLKPMYINDGKHVSACIIFKNKNQIYYKRIVQLVVNRGVLYKKQITDGTQNIFECDSGIISELGTLSGIRYSSIIGRVEFIDKIIIYDNNEIIIPHKNAKLFDQCHLIIN